METAGSAATALPARGNSETSMSAGAMCRNENQLRLTAMVTSEHFPHPLTRIRAQQNLADLATKAPITIGGQ
jgi:hypothetical protein